MPFRFATLVLPKGHPRPLPRPCDDRVEAVVGDGALAILVADGATGAGEGWQASNRVADLFLERCWVDPTAAGLAGLIRHADRLVSARHGGDADTTAIAMILGGGRIVGASAGDSQAYLVQGDAWTELTAHQARKPRVGSGAWGKAFEADLPPGAGVIAATDGLWQQAPMAEIRRIVAEAADPAGSVAALGDLVVGRALKGLADDLGIAVCMP